MKETFEEASERMGFDGKDSFAMLIPINNYIKFEQTVKNTIASINEKTIINCYFTDADFSGLYNPSKYVLNVEVADMKNENKLIKKITKVLFKNLDKNTLGLIWKVVLVKNTN